MLISDSPSDAGPSLRRKLGPAADGESLINTIHRGGYLFRVVKEP